MLNQQLVSDLASTWVAHNPSMQLVAAPMQGKAVRMLQDVIRQIDALPPARKQDGQQVLEFVGDYAADRLDALPAAPSAPRFLFTALQADAAFGQTVAAAMAV